jgi:hypothetical protein
MASKAEVRLAGFPPPTQIEKKKKQQTLTEMCGTTESLLFTTMPAIYPANLISPDLVVLIILSEE